MRNRDIHRLAMEQVDLAFDARRQGDGQAAAQHFREAYDLEVHAAHALEPHVDKEPTRSVLFRSAATLALDCHLLDEAERLVNIGLSGMPPDFIAQELRELQAQIYAERAEHTLSLSNR